MKELQEIYKYAKDLLNEEPEKSAYWHYNKLINKIEEAIAVTPCCTELCEHKNETLRQGDGFTYSVCSDCGDEI